MIKSRETNVKREGWKTKPESSKLCVVGGHVRCRRLRLGPIPRTVLVINLLFSSRSKNEHIVYTYFKLLCIVNLSFPF